MNKKIISVSLAILMGVTTVFTATSNPLNVEATTKKTYYTESGAYIYKSANKKTKKLKLLKQNQKVTTTTKASSKYYKVKVGSTTGYILKSKTNTKPTWYYYAYSDRSGAYTNRKKTTYVQLDNKKRNYKFVSHTKPTGYDTTLNGEDLLKISFNNKTYYMYDINVTIKPIVSKYRAYHKKIKAGQDYEYEGGYNDMYVYHSKARAKKMITKLEQIGYVRIPKDSLMGGMYTYKYEESHYGSSHDYEIRLNH